MYVHIHLYFPIHIHIEHTSMHMHVHTQTHADTYADADTYTYEHVRTFTETTREKYDAYMNVYIQVYNHKLHPLISRTIHIRLPTSPHINIIRHPVHTYTRAYDACVHTCSIRYIRTYMDTLTYRYMDTSVD